jgi:hypothetical protein
VRIAVAPSNRRWAASILLAALAELKATEVLILERRGLPGSAALWAKERGILVRPFSADRRAIGSAAYDSAIMTLFSKGQPNVLVAMHELTPLGTAMRDRARELGVPILDGRCSAMGRKAIWSAGDSRSRAEHGNVMKSA